MANQNPGIRRRSKDVLLVDVTAVDHIVEWASERRAELAVIGPEADVRRKDDLAGIVENLHAAVEERRDLGVGRAEVDADDGVVHERVSPAVIRTSA